MMNIKEFANKVAQAVEAALGTVVTVEEIVKNNTTLTGLRITPPSDGNVSPVVYVEDYYEMYRNGAELTDIILDIVDVIKEHTTPIKKMNLDVSFFSDYTKVRDRIVFKLIKAEGNEELLKTLVYKPFLDLAITFAYELPDEMRDAIGGQGSIRITNGHLSTWMENYGPISVDDLYKAAYGNTVRIRPITKTNLCELIEEMSGIPSEISLPIDVVYNEDRINGSVAMLYNDVLDEYSKKFGGALYVIPSSIHEIMVMAKDPSMFDPAIIRAVNETQVRPDEVLSNSLYVYENGKLQIAA